MSRKIAFCVILGTAVAGLFASHWSVMLAAACALTAISIMEHRAYQLRFAAVGMTGVFQTFVFSNTGVSFIAAIMAYGMGAAIRLATLA